MQVINKFSKSIWKKEEERFKKLTGKTKIPNKNLDEVDFLVLREESDFDG